MPNKPGARISARARLALRAERAMGISAMAVALPELSNALTPILPSMPPRVSSQNQPPAAVSSPSRPTTSNNLFAAATESTKDSAPAFLLPSELFASPPMPRAERVVALKQMDEHEVSGCHKCRLHTTRTKTVFGEGDPEAQIMFIGEGPGENEDLQGRPFVGKAGQLLEKMILAMGLSREQVFICNIVKCRPPNNREPAADETATCAPYLLRQIEIVRPDAIVTLGRPASQFLLQTKNSMSKLRGTWQTWRGIRVMPTYHPAYVLRQYTRETREAVWSDLKQVLVALDLQLPGAKSE